MNPEAVPRVVRRAAFIGYAALLVTLTHWPRLAIPSPHRVRLDLFIHAGAFATWAILLTLCGFFGAPLERRNIRLSLAVALAYALLDELTQGLPGLGRTVDPSDLLANGLGILAAALCLGLVARARRRRFDAR